MICSIPGCGRPMLVVYRSRSMCEKCWKLSESFRGSYEELERLLMFASNIQDVDLDAFVSLIIELDPPESNRKQNRTANWSKRVYIDSSTGRLAFYAVLKL